MEKKDGEKTYKKASSKLRRVKNKMATNFFVQN